MHKQDLENKQSLLLHQPAQPLKNLALSHLAPLHHWTAVRDTQTHHSATHARLSSSAQAPMYTCTPTREASRQSGRDVEVGRDFAGSMVRVDHAAVRVSGRRGRANVLRGGRSRREHVGRGAGGRFLVAARLSYLALEIRRVTAENVGNIVPCCAVGLLLLLLLLLVVLVWREAGGRIGGRAASSGGGVGGRIGVLVWVPRSGVQGWRPVHAVVGGGCCRCRRVAVVRQTRPHGSAASVRVELHIVARVGE